VKLKAWLELGRVSNLPTVWSNVMAGAVIGGGAIAPAALLSVLASGTVLYVGGMWLNDAFDAEIDARERPERPIPSGRVERHAVFGWGFSLLALGVLLLVPLFSFGGARGPGAAFAGACTAAAIVLYDRFHKGFALSPVVMGACRAGLYLMSALAFERHLRPDVTAAALLLLAYVVGLTYVARFESRSSVERLWPALFVFGPIAAAAVHVRALSPSALAFVAPVWLSCVAWVGYALVLARRGGPDNIRSAVGRLIAGIALLDALALAVRGALPLSGLALGAFVLTLLLQRRVRGT
jgi:4-hydroxybenzoate polyprenyltransferase